MKILVVGGAGFIGSNLTDALVKNRHQVVVLDNLSSGERKNINPKANFYKADLRNFKKVESILRKEKPAAIFHLAAQIDVRKSVEDPIFDAEINILSSLNLINLAHKYKTKKFIFSSSGGAIYGDTDDRPTREDHPEQPLSPYGIGKLTIDKYLNYFYRVHGFKYASLRYANVYGPRQNYKGEAGVVAIFINKMLAGEQPVINGDGKQTRDYVFVEDIVRANLMALRNLNKVGVYNIGTGVETNVNELFQNINQHFGNGFKEKHGPTKLGEQKTSSLNARKIKLEFGWKPTVKLKAGIKTTVNWFRNNAKIN